MPQSNFEPRIQQVDSPLTCCDEIWEDAYLRFETAEEEISKFIKRLKEANCERWPRDAQIVEIFCGRGNGLVALHRLGFSQLEGVDLSERLLRQYRGDAQLYIADCRKLPFPDNSRDIIVVQGGLHHLPELPGDFESVVAEVRRTLRPNGQFVVVEPWLTPFLRFVHMVCQVGVARRISPRVDALAIMIEQERTTYENWLNRPSEIQAILHAHFQPERCRAGWGKLQFIGRKS